MATAWYNRGLAGVAEGTIRLTVDSLKVLIVGTGYTFNKDHDFVADVSASEVSGTGYTGGFAGSGRKAVASPAVILDDTNDRVTFDFADILWTGIGITTPVDGIAAAAILWKPVTNDSDSIVIGFLDPTNLVTNGGDVTLTLPAGGVLRLQN